MRVISRGNPINLLLTGIALADCLVMVEYIPFTTHMYLLKRNVEEQVSLQIKYNVLKVCLLRNYFARI